MDKVEIQPAIHVHAHLLWTLADHVEVATVVKMMAVSSFPQAPYISTTIGKSTHLVPEYK